MSSPLSIPPKPSPSPPFPYSSLKYSEPSKPQPSKPPVKDLPNVSIGGLGGALTKEVANKEKNYQMTIEALNRRIETMAMEKTRNSDSFEEKVRRMTEENEGLKVKLERADENGGKAEENSLLRQKLTEANKKIEELDEMYKGQLAAFKRELISIKNQQQNHIGAGGGENQEKLKEAQENIKKLIDFNENLSRDNLALKSQLEERNREVNELKVKLESYYVNERRTLAPKNFNSSKASLVNSTPSRSGKGFFKLNFEEFEEKIQNLINENERLNNILNHNGNDSIMYSKPSSDLSNSRLIRENEDLKKNVLDLSNDNAVISKKLNDFDSKFNSMEKDFQEKLQRKEYDITRSYEKTLQEIEEQKEKNIAKISKENFELKQQNDDLQRQLAKYPKSKNEELPKLPENKSGSSAILIINEMLTPSVKPNEKNSKEQAHSNLKTNVSMKQTLPQIPENQDENISFNSEQKIKKNVNPNVVSGSINLDPKKQSISNTSNISSYGGLNSNSSNISTNYLSNSTTNNSSIYFNSGIDLKTEKTISGGNNSYNNNMMNNNMNSSNIISDGNSKQNFLKQGMMGLNSKSSQSQNPIQTLNPNPSSLLPKNNNNNSNNLMNNSMVNHNLNSNNINNYSNITNNNVYGNINNNNNYSNINGNNNNANNGNMNINVYNSMNSDSLGKEKFLTKGYANVGLQKITPTKDLVGKETNNSFKGDNANGNKSDPKEKECSTPLSRCDSNKVNEQKVSNFAGGVKSDVKKDNLIKDKKVIMFNLMENHRKSYNFQPGELYKQ